MSSPHHLLIRGIIPLFLAVTVLLGCIVSPAVAQQNPRALDPADVFFQAWLEIKKAEKLEKQEKFADAWQKYRQAAKYYDVLNRYHKNWKPHLVQSRVKSTRLSIKNIEPMAANELAGKTAKTRDLVEGGGKNEKPDKLDPVAKNKPPAGSGNQRLSSAPRPKQPVVPKPTPQTPTKPSSLPTPPTPPTPPSPPAVPMVSKTDAKLLRQLQRLERDNQVLRKDLQQLRNTRKGSTVEQQRLIDLIAKKDRQIIDKDREINTIRDILARAPLQKDMDAANAKLRTREREIEITARALRESQKKHQKAEQLVEKHRAEAELAQRRADEIAKNMKLQGDVNNRVIRELRKQLKDATALLEKTRQQLGDANSRMAIMQRRLDESQATIKELTEERDALRIERDALANILKKSDSKGVQKLITENMRLGRELKEALDRLKFLESSHNVTKDELVEARSDLAIAKTRIMRFQQEQKSHAQVVRSLESQLRDAQAALANARAQPDQDNNKEEIEILRGTVKRLIAAQERRRMGEKILWETYQKSKTTIAGMAAAFTDIRKTKVELTDQEKQLVTMRRPDGEFRNPERVPIAHARAHANALEAEIATYTPLMRRAFEKGRYEAARQILLDMDERFPGHFPTLCNRGVVELKTAQYAEAVEIFNEAITMRENSSYAHYMLGQAHYKNNNLTDARNAFERALDLKPGNARAHLYLGNLAGAGKRYQQAEEHFKMAIQIDPTLAEAYYNLSVLYLQQKRKPEALEYYRKALNQGAQPDIAHEQKLGK